MNYSLLKAKFIAGIETYVAGLAMLVLPQVLSYTSTFDFTQLGLSPHAASVVGGAIVLIRMADSVSEKVTPSDLTGGEKYGNNHG